MQTALVHVLLIARMLSVYYAGVLRVGIFQENNFISTGTRGLTHGHMKFKMLVKLGASLLSPKYRLHNDNILQ
jgi:hypothetical protein